MGWLLQDKKGKKLPKPDSSTAAAFIHRFSPVSPDFSAVCCHLLKHSMPIFTLLCVSFTQNCPQPTLMPYECRSAAPAAKATATRASLPYGDAHWDSPASQCAPFSGCASYHISNTSHCNFMGKCNTLLVSLSGAIVVTAVLSPILTILPGTPQVCF